MTLPHLTIESVVLFLSFGDLFLLLFLFLERDKIRQGYLLGENICDRIGETRPLACTLFDNFSGENII